MTTEAEKFCQNYNGNLPQRRVVCAAIRLKSQPDYIICSARHFDPTMRHVTPSGISGWQQGFIDQWGIFMSRQTAFIVAKEAGQIRNEKRAATGDTLFSEDLY
jgi:hypothetical protein